MQYDRKLLRDLADDVDQQHREAMPDVREQLGDIHFGGGVVRDARRDFLKRAGIGGAAVTIGSSVVPFTRMLAAAGAQSLDDPAIAMFAASVELAAVAAYKAAADTGKLDDTAKAVGTLFASHHQEHAGAFNGLLTKLGEKTVDAPNSSVLAAFGPKISGAADQAALLDIAFTIEEAAASTYVFGLGALQNQEAAAAVATILPIESQHAVALGTILGKSVSDYMPSFETDANALDPAKYPA